MILLDSVQKVLMKYGKAEQCDKNNVIIYKWHGKQTGIVMVDNRNEWNWLRVRGTVTSPVWQRIKKSKMFNSWLSLPVPVPPKSRAIVGYYAQIGFANPNCSMEVSYSISHHILNWIHWLDRLSFDSDFEAAVPLNS
uniref:Pecanex-like protein n=1 Tax=Caenorhabditis tropicalis TaxID=1561998 RepID=A0A1I7UMB1_9PELO